MSAYQPGARVDLWHDGAWRPATVVALTERQRAALRREWPLLDWSRAVGIRLERSPRVYDHVIAEPDQSDQLRVRGGQAPRTLRAVT